MTKANNENKKMVITMIMMINFPQQMTLTGRLSLSRPTQVHTGA